MKKGNRQVIAFYLPQYHPTPDNDMWWGKGFTEWTNVAKAKKLYPGHIQPKIPADLGFYDLRVPETRENQAKLAREAGISGFCYYHYWFGAGKQELEFPFNQVVETGEPDFPFCLCWANESWHCKFWNVDGIASKKLLVEQKYLGAEDNQRHFYSLLKAFKDPRYMTYKGHPIFMIYQPLQFQSCTEFMDQWNELAVENGLKTFHFIAQTANSKDIDSIFGLGFNAVNIYRLYEIKAKHRPLLEHLRQYFRTRILKYPYTFSYKKAISELIGEEEKLPNVYPTIIPNWDHTPRSGRGGYVLSGSTPELFMKHVDSVLDAIGKKQEDDQIVFLKSWNEWGEGNYMEPDLQFGQRYIDVMKTSISRH